MNSLRTSLQIDLSCLSSHAKRVPGFSKCFLNKQMVDDILYFRVYNILRFSHAFLIHCHPFKVQDGLYFSLTLFYR